MYCIRYLVDMKLGSPAFKLLQKIGDKICSRTLVKNGGGFSENHSRETIFLATTLCTCRHEKATSLFFFVYILIA